MCRALKLAAIMTESMLTPEEQEVFKSQIEACNANVARFEREIRAAQAKYKAEITMRDSLMAKLGSAHASTSGGDTAGSTKPNSGMGLSETIRTVIREHGRSMKPPAVAAELIRRQFPYSAGTPLATRVGNEMRRMARAGMLTRHGSKYQVIQPTSPSNGTAAN